MFAQFDKDIAYKVVIITTNKTIPFKFTFASFKEKTIEWEKEE